MPQRSVAPYRRSVCLEKKTIRAAEADPVERAKFARQQKRLPVENLVFIDEFGSNLAMTPTHARSPQGERAEVSEPFNQGSNISTIGSLSLCGVGPTMSIEGAADTQVFDAYVEKFLVPSLLPGDIVLLMIFAAGSRIVAIPSHSFESRCNALQF